MKLLEKIKYFDEKEIRFLDIPIAQYGTKKSKRCSEKYFSLFPKSFEQKFLDTILKPLYKKHDYIFIVRTAGIGEAYLLNFMVDEIIKKYRIKSPCFVIWRKCYADMFNLYWPDIPIYYCNTPNTFLLRNRFGKYKNVPFQIVHATIEESHKAFGKFEYDQSQSWPDVIRCFAGIPTFTKRFPIFSAKDKNVLQTVAEIGLNINKFIMLIPEANAVRKLPENFWITLSTLLQEKGYDIFVNTCSQGDKYPCCKSAQVTLSQAMYLASKARAIISLRCGLVELLSTLNVPKYVLYNHYVHNPICAEKVMQVASLELYPFVDSDTVYEFNAEKMEQNELINEILSKIISNEVKQ